MVNMYKPGLTNLQQAILRLLYVKAGSVLNQRQIAKCLDVSQAAVTKAIPWLEKNQFIKISKDKETKRWSVELNRSNHRMMQFKRADNLKLIYESGLADFLEREAAGASIVLFGSYSRGEDTINSDIDVAVIGRKEKDINTVKFEKMLERRININFYESWIKMHKNLRENICNGIILVGGAEL